jgi:hypothetical protein
MKPFCPGERRRRALADDERAAAVVLFPPREVVMVVHALHGLGLQDLQHAIDHPVAARVGVFTGDAHRRQVIIGERRAE